LVYFTGLFSCHECMIYLETSPKEAWYCVHEFWLRKSHKERVNGVVISGKIHLYACYRFPLLAAVHDFSGLDTTWASPGMSIQFYVLQLIDQAALLSTQCFLLLLLKRAKFS